MDEATRSGNPERQKLLSRAAGATMERIRRDRDRAPERLKRLVADIEERLFEWQFDVNRLSRSYS